MIQYETLHLKQQFHTINKLFNSKIVPRTIRLPGKTIAKVYGKDLIDNMCLLHRGREWL